MFEHLKQCQKCELGKTRRNIVIGQGPVPAEVLILGEAPGQEEDREGNPFIGRAGKILDAIFALLKLDRLTMFISNCLLCWTGKGNPDPTEPQLLACKENVEEILKTVNPKYIVPLGNFALRVTTGKNIITNYRGKFVKPTQEILNILPDVKIFPTFHPASTFHDASRKAKIIEDFAYIKSLIDPEDYGLEFICVNSLDIFDKMCAEVCGVGLTSFDLETTGLRFNTNKIIGASFSSDRKRGYYIPILIREDEDDKNSKLISYWNNNDERYINTGIINILSNTQIQKTGQNLIFDRKFSKKKWDVEVKNICFDSLLAAHLIDENCKHELGVLSNRYIDLIGYKRLLERDLLKKEIQAGDYSKAKLETLTMYGCGDSISALRLTEDLYNEMKGTKLEDIMFGISLPMMDVIYDMEMRGVRVDREYLSQLKIDFSKDLNEIEQNIFNMADMKFNINSTDQLSDVLFRRLKLKRGKETKKSTKENTKYSTDKSVLEKLFNEHEIIKYILQYRTVAKLLSTYIIGVEERLSDDDILYANFGITGTVTGRLNSTDPNLENIATSKVDVYDLDLDKYRAKIRPMYIPRDGHLFLPLDYSQLEIRLLAYECHDEKLIEILNSGEDIHTGTAKLIFNTDEPTEEHRKRAKTINFGMIYGMSPYSLAMNLKITKEEAARFITRYFSIFSKIKPWKMEVISFLNQNLYVEHALGRRRRFPEYRALKSYNDEDKKKIEAKRREAINFQIQGLGSDIVKLAQIRCAKEYPDAHQIIQIHDEIMFEVGDNKAEKYLKLLIEEMEQPVTPIDIPLPVEGRIEKRWGIPVN